MMYRKDVTRLKEKFACFEILLLQYLKRDWKKTIFWILGVGLFSSAFVPAFKEIAEGQGLAGMFETLQNPAMIAMVGPTPVDSAADYTIGAMYAHEMLLFCGLFSMIISILHVVGHTRKEEDLGLTELVRSFRVGRQANSLAVLIETMLINILLSLFIAVVMISFNVDTIDAAGAVLFGISVGIAGILGAVIALVMSQVMPTSSGATGTSLGIIGLMYIIRASTDSINVDYSMFNPLSWVYLTYPFTENNWMPVISAIVLILILSVLAFALEGRRDMGAGYLPERSGRSHASKALLSVPGLYFRINRAVIISWMIAFVIMGLAYGSIYGDMQSFLQSNELMQQMFTMAGSSIEESFTGTIMAVMVGLSAILPVAVVNKLYTEENRQHLSQIYATKVTRTKFYWTSIGTAVTAGILGIFLSALSLGFTALGSMDDTSAMGIIDFLAAGFNFLPVVLCFIGLAAFLLGWFPKLGKVVYIYLTYSFLLDYFQGILDLPKWFTNTAAFSWLPKMPVDAFETNTFLIITAAGFFLMIIGYIGYRKRDLKEGV